MQTISSYHPSHLFLSFPMSNVCHTATPPLFSILSTTSLAFRLPPLPSRLAPRCPFIPYDHYYYLLPRARVHLYVCTASVSCLP